jgi:hypothetical protein
MLERGKLYYFSEYDFERAGSDKKNKFFIIISNPTNHNVIAILVTSQGYHLPTEHRKGHNKCVCNQHHHCFELHKDIVITDRGFAFKLDSYIPITKNVICKGADYIWGKYIITNLYEDKGTLADEVLFELAYCISKKMNGLENEQKEAINTVVRELIPKEE